MKRCMHYLLAFCFFAFVVINPLFSQAYFENNDYQKVLLIYRLENDTAYPLNITADKLLRSILAEAGIFKAEIASTKRTFYDQAAIMKLELSQENLVAWYGQDVADAVNRLDIRSLEQWLRLYKPKISRHIAGYAIDVIVVNNELLLNDPENIRLRDAYDTAIRKLLKFKENGIHFYLRENNGCEHTEFTFPVTSTVD